MLSSNDPSTVMLKPVPGCRSDSSIGNGRIKLRRVRVTVVEVVKQ